MTAYELLQDFLGKLKVALPDVEQRAAFSGGEASYLLRAPVLTGEVAEERRVNGGWQGKLTFRLYLPGKYSLEAGEKALGEIFTAALGYPQFAGVVRTASGRDKITSLACTAVTFTFSGNGGAPVGVTLGGKDYQIAGWKVSMAQKGEELFSVGENKPFAAIDKGTEYTVELEGIDAESLENLTGFTALLGDETYTACRWKAISPGEKKAVFTAFERG